MRDISLDRRYLIPIMLGVIALGGAGYAVGSTDTGHTSSNDDGQDDHDYP